jgi:hypothetical protein
VRKCFETIWVDIKSSRWPRVERSIASSHGIPGGDLRRKDHRSLKLLMALSYFLETGALPVGSVVKEVEAR